MHLFGTLGMLMFLIGFGIVFWLAIERILGGAEYGLTNKVTFYVSLTAMILGTQFFLAGFLAELVSRSAADRNHYLIEQKLRIDK